MKKESEEKGTSSNIPPLRFFWRVFTGIREMMTEMLVLDFLCLLFFFFFIVVIVFSFTLWRIEQFTGKSPRCMWEEVEQQRATMDDTQKRFSTQSVSQCSCFSSDLFISLVSTVGFSCFYCCCCCGTISPLARFTAVFCCEPFPSVHFSRVIGHVANCSALLRSTLLCSPVRPPLLNSDDVVK